MKIEIEDGVTPIIENLAIAFDDLTEPFTEFGKHYLAKIDRQFITESDPYGTQWAPLTAAYLNNKLRKGLPAAKLQRHPAVLRASTAFHPDSSLLAIGFNDPKAPFHDRGTQKMAQRQLLPDPERGLPDEDSKELEAIMARYVAAQWE